MINDKYLKNSLNFQRLNDLAKKYNLKNYIPGQSFDSVKEKMSEEDFETSQKLMDYYTNQKNLTDDFNYNNQTIENNRKKQLQENAISKEMTMRYLPEYLKLQGLGGLGVSESSIIEANNNFRNARNTINSDMETQKSILLKNYQENLKNLDIGASNEMSSIRDKYENLRKEEASVLYNNMITIIDYGEFNTIDELEVNYNSIKNKLEESQKNVIESKINYYKNNKERIELDIEYKLANNIELNEREKKLLEEKRAEEKKLQEEKEIAEKKAREKAENENTLIKKQLSDMGFFNNNNVFTVD